MPDENKNNGMQYQQSDAGINARRDQIFYATLEEHTELLRNIARNTQVSVDGIGAMVANTSDKKTTTTSSFSSKSNNEVVKSLRDLINVVGEQTKYMGKKDVIESDRYKIEYQKRITEMLGQQSEEFKDQATALQQFLAEQQLTNKPLKDLIESGVFDIRETGKLVGKGGSVYTEEESTKIATAVGAIMGKIESPDKKDKLDMGDFIKKEKLRYKTDKNEEKKWRSDYSQTMQGLAIISQKGFKNMTDALEKSNYNLLSLFSNKLGGIIGASLVTAFISYQIGKKIGNEIVKSQDIAEERELIEEARRLKPLREASRLADIKAKERDARRIAQLTGEIGGKPLTPHPLVKTLTSKLSVSKGAKKRLIEKAISAGIIDPKDTALIAKLSNMPDEDLIAYMEAQSGGGSRLMRGASELPAYLYGSTEEYKEQFKQVVEGKNLYDRLANITGLITKPIYTPLVRSISELTDGGGQAKAVAEKVSIESELKNFKKRTAELKKANEDRIKQNDEIEKHKQKEEEKRESKKRKIELDFNEEQENLKEKRLQEDMQQWLKMADKSPRAANELFSNKRLDELRFRASSKLNNIPMLGFMKEMLNLKTEKEIEIETFTKKFNNLFNEKQGGEPQANISNTTINNNALAGMSMRTKVDIAYGMGGVV